MNELSYDLFKAAGIRWPREAGNLYRMVTSREYSFRDALHDYRNECRKYCSLKLRLKNPVNEKNGKPLAESVVRTMTFRAKTWPNRRDGLLIAIRALIAAGYNRPRRPSNVIDFSKYRRQRYTNV